MHILHVVGARPNFMKLAPVHRALARKPGRQTIVHTGQHYDAALADAVWKNVGLPDADLNLGIGSGSHGQQTGRLLPALEECLLARRPDLVVVYGDVNSTMAATLAAAKLCIPVAHVEAGLRSFDRTMPEEINRLVTDQLASHLFTPSQDGDENLKREGVDPDRIKLVGNVMIDTLVALLPVAEGQEVVKRLALNSGNSVRPFVLVTLHRPSNVDDPESLRRLIDALEAVAAKLRVVFPVHPRTRRRMAEFGIDARRVTLTDPLGYLDFLGLQRQATVVITDSGGIQEETTWLGIPCLTMRENTERPVTLTMGTNTLVGRDTERMKLETFAILDGGGKRGSIPPLWDGHASERIADYLVQ